LFDGGSGETEEGSGDRDSFNKRWGWWQTLDNLTNSRIDKWDIVLEWNVIKALNIVAYYSDKQKVHMQIHKDQMQKIKRR
jgi:hypothetical protein